MTDLEALVVAAYVFADEYPVPARPGPAAKISDAELVALAVCQAAMGICSDRQFLGLGLARSHQAQHGSEDQAQQGTGYGSAGWLHTTLL